MRVVDEMIERLKIEPLKRQYKRWITSAYHPKMLLKVLVYAYTQQTYSSRKITQALRENIIFQWLSGMSQPDHRTINRFRRVVMKQVVEEVFYGVLEPLLEMGLGNLEKYFFGCEKIEASANRCSFMRRKNREKNKANLQKKVKKLLDQIDELEEGEDRRYGDKDYPDVGEGVEIDVEEMKKAAEKISRRLEKDQENKTLKKGQRDLEKVFITREEKYEWYEETF